MQIVEYLTEGGVSPFARWFDGLDRQAAAKVAIALDRLRAGNLASLKSLRDNVLECRIDWGPGYRIYLGREGGELVVLLGGGTKRRQAEDIAAAIRSWSDYRRRKRL